jgi:hypothetical protein
MADANTGGTILAAGYSRGKLMLLTFGSAVFVLVGLMLLGTGDPLIMFFGFLGVAFFGYCLTILIKRFGEHGVVLRVDEKGIFDTRATDMTIPWTAIAGVGQQTIANSTLIGLVLREPVEKYVTTPAKLKLIEINKKLGFSAGLYIGPSGLTASPDEIFNAMKAGIDRYSPGV